MTTSAEAAVLFEALPDQAAPARAGGGAMSRLSPAATGWIAAGLGLAADQASKLWLLYGYDLAGKGPIAVAPFAGFRAANAADSSCRTADISSRVAAAASCASSDSR